MSNLILEVEVRCHKVQGMTEAFTDTLYSHAKTSSSVHQKAIFTLNETVDIFARDYAIKKLPSCPAPCDYAPPPPESSCSRSSYQRFLVSELKYRFPNTFRSARAQVSRNLNYTEYVISIQAGVLGTSNNSLRRVRSFAQFSLSLHSPT